MLISLQALVADASAGWQPYSTGESPAEAVGSHLRPEDPSTLTLALIGAATMAVYLAVRRGARDAGSTRLETMGAPAMLADVVAGTEAVATIDNEQLSLGAA